MPRLRALPAFYIPTLNEYLEGKNYSYEMCVGAMISVCALVAVFIAIYLACNQNVDMVADKIAAVAGAGATAPVDCVDGADDDSDVEAPMCKAVEILIPFDAPPTLAIPMRVYTTTPRRRIISRTHSAPSFTVPLSPSDAPVCVF